MRRSRSIPLGALCVLALLQSVGARTTGGQAGSARRLADVPPRSGRHRLLAAHADQRRERVTLTHAWSYRLQTDGGADVNSQATPIVVNGVMYFPAGSSRRARSGNRHRDMAAPGDRRCAIAARRRVLARRRRHRPRIIFTAGRRLIALDAATGALVLRLRHKRRSRHGRPVQLGAARPRQCRGRRREHAAGHPGGSATPARTMRARARSSGSSARCRSRATSATTHGKATAGRTGSASTPGRSTSPSTNRAACSTFRSPRRFPAPTAATAGARTCSATPSSQWISRRARTSGISRRSITISGMPIRLLRRRSSTSPQRQTVPALALTTKSGYLYLLNRENRAADVRRRGTAGPEERRSRRGGIPTQPIPVKPPPLARVSYRTEDLVTAADTTPEHAAACAELVQKSAAFPMRGPLRRGGFAPEKRRGRWCFRAGWAAPTGAVPRWIRRPGSCSSRRRMSARSAR